MPFNSEMLFSIVKQIIPYFVVFLLGLLVEHIRMKNSYIREKARSIDATTLPQLREKINELRTLLNNKTYIKLEKRKPEPILKLDSNHFIDMAKSCDIFDVVNDKIILIYTKDRYLKMHMKITLDYLNDYHTRVYELKKLIESLYSSKPPVSFPETLEKIGIDEFGQERFKSWRLTEEDLIVLYVLAMTGSNNSYKSGTSFVINLLEKRFDDLQSAVVNNSETKFIFNEIQTEISEIESDLTSAFDEIQKLHETWQNELII